MKSYNQGYISNCFTHTTAEIIQNNCFQARWKDKTLINYIDKKWRLEYPESYEDGHRHQSTCQELNGYAGMVCSMKMHWHISPGHLDCMGLIKLI